MGTQLDVEDKLSAWTTELQRLLATKQSARRDAQRHLEEYETRVARYDQQIDEIEDSLRALPTLQATVASLRVARPQMIGSPVLMWVDPSATTIQGPSVIVFPRPLDDPEDSEDDRDSRVERPRVTKRRPHTRTRPFDDEDDDDDE